MCCIDRLKWQHIAVIEQFRDNMLSSQRLHNSAVRQQSNIMRRLLILSLIIVVGGTWGVFTYGGALAKPSQHDVGLPPDDLDVEVIKIPRSNSTPIAGWYVTGDRNGAGVLLLHGIRSNRLQMVERARFLNNAGYSILLIDMQGHGETAGKHITFGYRESIDAHKALEYLKSRIPGRPIGVIGVSLGGAATLLGTTPIEANAVVLESVYSSFEQAVQNRLEIRFGEYGRLFAPLLLWQVKPRLDISLESLSPVAAIPKLSSPVLIISGTEDKRTLPIEAKDLFSNAPEPKSLWMVEGAKHQDLHLFNPGQYENRILQFFQQYLRHHAA